MPEPLRGKRLTIKELLAREDKLVLALAQSDEKVAALEEELRAMRAAHAATHRAFMEQREAHAKETADIQMAHQKQCDPLHKKINEQNWLLNQIAGAACNKVASWLKPGHDELPAAVRKFVSENRKLGLTLRECRHDLAEAAEVITLMRQAFDTGHRRTEFDALTAGRAFAQRERDRAAAGPDTDGDAE